MGQTKAQRGKEGKHVRVYRKQTSTPAWLHLSGSAVKVALAMMMFDNGENNGAIYFSDRIGAEKTGLSRNTVWKALRQLEELGFIYCTERGGFSRKTRHAACYGFTWLAGPPGPHRAPSHAYERWQPCDGNTRAQKLTATGTVSNHSVETPAPTGADIGPDELEKSVVSAKVHLSGIGPQTVYQGIGSEAEETDQRKQANPLSGAFPDALRTSLAEHLTSAEPGTQSTIAQSIGCPGGTLSKFLSGRNLPQQYQGPLIAYLGRGCPPLSLAG